MRLATLFIAVSSFMQLTSIWMHGAEGHSLGGWASLFAGLLMITHRSYKQPDPSAFYSFFLQTTIVGLIIMSILYLEYV